VRKVRFRRLPAVGPVPGPWKDAPVAEVLLEDRFFPARGVIPPFDVFNEILKSGRLAHGMSSGVQWKPLAVSSAEYDEIVRVIRQRRPGTRVIAAAPWVKTIEDWTMFLDETLDGIPARVQRPYVKRLAMATAELFAAFERKDREAIQRCSAQEIALRIELETLKEKYRSAKRTG